jgi:glycosyltransferase involved in cell wall biosynthesis
LLETRVPLAVDLYDPMLLEGLDLVSGEDRAAVDVQFTRYQRLTEAQLRRGDFFFCATDRQRDYWLGALTAMGRITPDLVSRSDRELQDLIDLVPSGIAAAPPSGLPAVLRNVHPSIGPDDIILLWAGGLWDWFEPDLLVRAMAELNIERPRLKLVFFAGARPAADGVPYRTRTHARARALAAELEVLDRSVIFLEEWVPYAQRAAYLREADIGVSAHRPGAETRFAFRTRLLDYIWARLPVICSSGDSLGEEIALAGMGDLVAPGDLGGWVAALRRVGDDPILRANRRAAANVMAERYAWDAVARPLARFCSRPRRTTPLSSSDVGRIAELERTLRERDAYIHHVEQQYQNAITEIRRVEQDGASASGTRRGQAANAGRRLFARLQGLIRQRTRKP